MAYSKPKPGDQFDERYHEVIQSLEKLITVEFKARSLSHFNVLVWTWLNIRHSAKHEKGGWTEGELRVLERLTISKEKKTLTVTLSCDDIVLDDVMMLELQEKVEATKNIDGFFSDLVKGGIFSDLKSKGDLK